MREHLQVYDNYYGMNGLIVNHLLSGTKAGQCNQFNQNFDALTIVRASVWERMIFHVPLCVFLIKNESNREKLFRTASGYHVDNDGVLSGIILAAG